MIKERFLLGFVKEIIFTEPRSISFSQTPTSLTLPNVGSIFYCKNSPSATYSNATYVHLVFPVFACVWKRNTECTVSACIIHDIIE